MFWQALFREGVKNNVFFWEIFPKCGWVGWLIPKQGPNPSNPPPNHPENRRLKPEFHLSRSQISQEPQVGWIGPRIWENFAQKTSLPKVANKQTL